MKTKTLDRMAAVILTICNELGEPVEEAEVDRVICMPAHDTYKAYVEGGRHVTLSAIYLDEHCPGWRHLIHVRRIMQ